MLRLRPLRPDDEAAFLAGHDAMAAADDFSLGLGLEPGMTWTDYLRTLSDHRAGRNLPDHFVPSTFLVGDVDGQIVGRVSIRHELNDFLRARGGHIGYGVLPEHRGRGYAAEILRRALVVARSLGIDRVLITCDDDNLASSRVVETCGGKLESVLPAEPGTPALRRYWVD